MSTKYRNSRDVPLDTIITRLNELSDAVIGGRESQSREFTMRIPAECDRDADLVMSEAAVRLESLQSENEALLARVNQQETLTDRIEELETMVKVFRGCIETGLIPGLISPCYEKVISLVGDNDGQHRR